MKKLILAIALLTAPLAPVVLTGCKAPQQVIVYKSLAATQATVESARKAFLDAYNSGRVDQATAARAVTASANFNAHYNQAVLTARTTAAPTPENVAQLASEFLLIVSNYIAK